MLGCGTHLFYSVASARRKKVERKSYDMEKIAHHHVFRLNVGQHF